MLEELGKKIDLTGQRFGKWTVTDFAGNDKWGAPLWKSICDCGTRKNHTSYTLQSGRSTNCGCTRRPELIGQVFGELTVVSQHEGTDKKGQRLWVCLCSCGETTTVATTPLKNGNTKSCGHTKKKLDLTGEVYGQWEVLKEVPRLGTKGTRWLCQCDCGNQREISGTNLRSKSVPSCNCSTGGDLLGKRFVALTVIERLHNRNKWGNVQWLCECDCGNQLITTTSRLNIGNVTSCGCSRILDISGERFGKLKVIEITDKRTNWGDIIWKCRCDCGEEKEISGSPLKTGHIASCGCSARGENHPNYNPLLTDGERMMRRYDLKGNHINKWRKDVYNHDNHMCQSCNQRGGNLNAHHLNAWNAFPEQRFDTANGITLCEDCHKEFHHFNGYGNNTLEEFRDHLACTVGEEHVLEIEEALLSRESEIIGQEQQTRELQTT